ncbi:MAG: hypothetical protein ACI4Q8_01720 [Ruminococcus sp.]
MKKIIALILTTIMLIGVISISANAFSIPENVIPLPINGTSANGEFTKSDNAQYFNFTLETAGMVYFEVKSGSCPKNQAITGTVYNEDMSIEEFTTGEKTVNEHYIFDIDCNILDAGTYILKLESDAEYTFTVACIYKGYGEKGDFTKEPNNTFADAKLITENQEISGVLSKNDMYDIYKFTIEKRQKLTLFNQMYLYSYMSFDTDVPNLEAKIFDEYGKNVTKEVYYNSFTFGEDKNNKEWDNVREFILNPGTYYMCLNFDDEYSRDFYLIKYELCDVEPLITIDGYYAPPRWEEFELEVADQVQLGITDAEVKEWKVQKPNVLKINKNAKITALCYGYSYVTAILTNGKKVKCSFYVKNNPTFTYKGKPVTYTTLKKGKTKNIFIDGRVAKIKSTYKGNNYVKVTGNRLSESFKIKGLKKGLSVIKIKVNCNWYYLSVRVK